MEIQENQFRIMPLTMFVLWYLHTLATRSNTY
jgi:hypothetical protein